MPTITIKKSTSSSGGSQPWHPPGVSQEEWHNAVVTGTNKNYIYNPATNTTTYTPPSSLVDTYQQQELQRQAEELAKQQALEKQRQQQAEVQRQAQLELQRQQALISAEKENQRQFKILQAQGVNPFEKKNLTKISYNESSVNEYAINKSQELTTIQEVPAKTIQSQQTQAQNTSTFFDLFAGETGKQHMGIGYSIARVPKTPKEFIQSQILATPKLTFQEIQTGLRTKGGAIGKVTSYFIPTSPLEIGLTLGTLGVYTYGSPFVKTAISGYTAYSGTKTALNPSLSTEERIAGGIMGGLGTAGFLYETSPYIKGAIAKLSPKYQPTTLEETGQIVKNIPRANEQRTFDISLIKPGKEAYGFSYAEQKAYTGKIGDITTSARDLVKIPNTILNKNIKIVPGEEGYGLFATPFEIKTGTAQTRISRLGIQNTIDLFKSPKTETKLSFKLTKESPQFVVFEKTKITKSGTPGTFKALGKPSSELEVTALGEITNIKKIALTTLKGQKVDIFSAQLKGSLSDIALSSSDLSKAGLKFSTAVPTQKTSALGLFGTGFVSSTIPTKTTRTTNTLKSLSSPSLTKTIFSPSKPIYLKENNYSPSISSYSSPSITSIPISIFTSSPPTPKYNKTNPFTPTKPTARKKTSSFFPTIAKGNKGFTNSFKQPKMPSSVFSVQVRRFGKWKPYARGSTIQEAFNLGKGYTLRSLGASFKVNNVGAVPTPWGYYRKQEKGESIFIQKRKGRISSLGEKSELSMWRNLTKTPKIKKSKSKRRKGKSDIFDYLS